MLVPYNWREEVRAIVGNKKASSYTFRFLLFLRYQYEMQRRAGKKKTPPFLKQGCYSIRINDQWRIVFKWDVQPYDVQIMDYH